MIPVALLKSHLRIPHDLEDALLAEYEAAAVSFLERRSGETWTDMHAPERVRLAVMQLVAHWYANRTPVTEESLASIPMSVTELVPANPLGFA
jgi:uncharacterized phage protein (predicted DNA packaging)